MLSVQVELSHLPLIQAIIVVLDQSKPGMDDELEMKICVFGLHGGLWVVTLDHELCQVKLCHWRIKGNILLCVWLSLADSLRKNSHGVNKQAWAQKSESFAYGGRTDCFVYSSLKGSRGGKQWTWLLEPLSVLLVQAVLFVGRCGEASVWWNVKKSKIHFRLLLWMPDCSCSNAFADILQVLQGTIHGSHLCYRIRSLEVSTWSDLNTSWL